METFKHEELEKLGFDYVDDGGTMYFELILGKDYFNDPYIYAEKVRMGEYRVYDGKTHQPLERTEVIKIVKEMED